MNTARMLTGSHHPWTSVLVAGLITSTVWADAPSYFTIRVVDEQTGRGVPMIELRTTNHIVHYTDSNGLVAFHEPGLMGLEVYFHVEGHGYEYPKDGFGNAGRRLRVEPGGRAELKLRRINIAERLYRITGAGIYRDSVLAGEPVPIREPVINGLVMGQDSIQTIMYRGTFYWFWGDTGKPSYPLGNFHMSGATLRLPEQGGLDPDLGVDLTYFVNEEGFSRQMAPRPEPGPVWLDSYVTLPDEDGEERMFAAYARVTPAMESVERGFMRFNDETETLEKIVEYDLDAPVRPRGHPFKHIDEGAEYIWFPSPFPLVRVRADMKSYLDVTQYEAWTPLKEGSRLEKPEIDRDEDGKIRYAWRRNTPELDQKQQNELISAGLMKPEEAWIQLQDADTGKAVLAHNGSVYWNDYRGRWITIRSELMGTSMVGEVWYAEADTPLGPWIHARKIVTHDRYTFYNPKHHPEFDRNGGRIIFFEGTYTKMFSGREEATPRYDYNQIMYRLDLTDSRLAMPVAVYQRHTLPSADGLATLSEMDHPPAPGTIAFYAPDRRAEGTLPVFMVAGQDGYQLRPGEEATTSAEHTSPVFHAFPPGGERPEAVVPLYEFAGGGSARFVYTTDPEWSAPGFVRTDVPVCYVWPNPMAAVRVAD